MRIRSRRAAPGGRGADRAAGPPDRCSIGTRRPTWVSPRSAATLVAGAPPENKWLLNCHVNHSLTLMAGIEFPARRVDRGGHAHGPWSSDRAAENRENFMPQ